MLQIYQTLTAGMALTVLLAMTVTTARAEENRFVGLFPENIKTVALVAPASPASSPAKVDEGIRLMKEAGLKVKVMPHAREGEPAGFTSIAAEKRIADLEQAWLDPEVDMILCIRGGAGTPDILSSLDWDKLRTRPDMPVLGFSDITALECAMLKEKAGHPYAAPSLSSLLAVDKDSVKSMRAVLAGKDPEPVQLKVLHPGTASGVALAGHLVLLDTMCHTKYRPDTTDKVIFIECPRTLDLVQKSLKDLEKNGFFAHCSGVVFGHLSGCTKQQAEAVMQQFAATANCPVYAGFPYGHTADNHTIDLRRKVSIDEKWLLRFE